MMAIITGGKGYQLTEDDRVTLDELQEQYGIEHVVTGVDSDVDRGICDWARDNHVGLSVFHDTDIYQRYKNMMAYVGYQQFDYWVLIVFPGVRCKDELLRLAEAHKVAVIYPGEGHTDDKKLSS